MKDKYAVPSAKIGALYVYCTMIKVNNEIDELIEKLEKISGSNSILANKAAKIRQHLIDAKGEASDICDILTEL